MAEHDKKKRADEVFGLRDITPDRPEAERLNDPREGVGEAGEVERVASESTPKPSGVVGVDLGAGGDRNDTER